MMVLIGQIAEFDEWKEDWPLLAVWEVWDIFDLTYTTIESCRFGLMYPDCICSVAVQATAGDFTTTDLKVSCHGVSTDVIINLLASRFGDIWVSFTA